MSDTNTSAFVRDRTEAFLGLRKAEIDTPALLVDLNVFESNVGCLSGYFRDHGIQWRPHSKAHKSPAVARLLLEAGASGITCAKVGEAEVMAAGGVKDILVANTVVTRTKLRRLAAVQRHARVLVAVDDADVISATGAAATEVGATIPVLVDIDIGMNRTGVNPGAQALELARLAAATSGVELSGIMGYEGHVLTIEPRRSKVDACHQALAHLVETRDLLQRDGLPVEIVSAGGTGCYDITGAYDGITEVQAGGGIFMDNMYRHQCFVEGLDQALTVLATVTSRHAGHVVTDAGFKTMSAAPKPTPVGLDNFEMRYLSAEHGVWDLVDGASGPGIGEQVEFVVGYSDSTNFLHDRFLALRDGVVEAVWELEARGRLT